MINKLTILSHLFPNESIPYQGKFVADQVSLIKTHSPDTNLSVVVPSPIAIPFTQKNTIAKSRFIQFPSLAKRVNYFSIPRLKFPKIVQKSYVGSLQKSNLLRDAEIVHVHFLYPNGLIIPFLKSQGIKTVLSIHGSDYFNIANLSAFQPIISNIFKEVDLILPVGPQLCEAITNKFPVTRGKTHQINNFVDELKYSLPDTQHKINLKSGLGWDHNKIHILSISKNRPEKGLDILFGAIEHLNSLSDKVQFHIIGDINDPMRSTNLNVSSIIDVIPPMSSEKLIKYFHASDMFVSPSRREGFGLALIEAAATGLPIIATPTGIAPKIIDKNIGVLTSDFSTEELAKSIEKMIGSYQDFDSSYIRESVISKFGSEIFSKKLFEHYNSLLE